MNVKAAIYGEDSNDTLVFLRPDPDPALKLNDTLGLDLRSSSAKVGNHSSCGTSETLAGTSDVSVGMSGTSFGASAVFSYRASAASLGIPKGELGVVTTGLMSVNPRGLGIVRCIITDGLSAAMTSAMHGAMDS